MKKWVRKAVCLAITMVIAGSLTACRTGQESLVADKKSDKDTVRVGIVIPQSGELAAFGYGTEEMTRYAIEQINEKGGIEIDGTNKKLSLVVADSQSKEEQAGVAAKNLIENENVDIMLTSHTAQTTVPVAETCEKEGIMCLSVDTPDEAWAVHDYNYCYHAGFSTENELLCFKDAWDLAGISGGKIGLLHADDLEGQTMAEAMTEFAQKNGYQVYDPGAYEAGSNDYKELIGKLEAENCDGLAGVMISHDLRIFYSQMKKSEYLPKVCTIAKAALFEEDVNAIGMDGVADGLCSEVWWTVDHPYYSSISGQNCKEIGMAWIELTKDDYAPALAGYDYANVEILYQVLKSAGSLDIRKLCAAADALDVDTIIGNISFNERHYSEQKLITGQWDYRFGTWTQNIIANTQVPDCPVTETIKILQ